MATLISNSSGEEIDSQKSCVLPMEAQFLVTTLGLELWSLRSPSLGERKEGKREGKKEGDEKKGINILKLKNTYNTGNQFRKQTFGLAWELRTVSGKHRLNVATETHIFFHCLREGKLPTNVTCSRAHHRPLKKSQ